QVDLEVALRFDTEVEAGVLAELLEHVIEERDAGGDGGRAAAVDDEHQVDGGLLRLAFDLGLANYRHAGHATTSGRAAPSAARNASFSAGEPTVRRRQPSTRGHDEKSRMSTPRSSKRCHR